MKRKKSEAGLKVLLPALQVLVARMVADVEEHPLDKPHVLAYCMFIENAIKEAASEEIIQGGL